jgi:hypothetical protein
MPEILTCEGCVHRIQNQCTGFICSLLDVQSETRCYYYEAEGKWYDSQVKQ